MKYIQLKCEYIVIDNIVYTSGKMFLENIFIYLHIKTYLMEYLIIKIK